MRPEKDTINPPGQIVNPVGFPQRHVHPVLGDVSKPFPYPQKLGAVAQRIIEDTPPTTARSYLEGLLKAWREEKAGVTYPQLVKLLEMLK